MAYTLKLEHEIVEDIVRDSLKESVLLKLEDLTSESDEKEFSMFLSLLDTLEYYSTAEQYEEFISTIRGKLYSIRKDILEEKISGVETKVEDDGSLTITLEVSEDVKDNLASDGIMYHIVKEFVGAETDDMLISWAQRGKKEMQMDKAIGGFDYDFVS